MEQHPLDFDTLHGSIIEPVKQLTRNTGVLVEKVIGPKSFKYEEDFIIGNHRFHFRMSPRFKDGTYKLDENQKVRFLAFAIQDKNIEYRFEVSIENYEWISREHERLRYNDDSIGDSIGRIKIGSIRKIDHHKNGPKYSNKDGDPITSFEFFRYIFGPGIGDKIIGILKSVIIQITREIQ